MPDILNMLDRKDQLDFSQNFAIARPAYLGDRIFPDIKTQHFKAEYLRLAAGDQLPTMGYVHALDTEAHIASRPPITRVTVEKLLIKEKINQTESLRMAKENGINEDNAVLDYIYNDWARLAEMVRCRTEVAKMEVLASGAMTIAENNLNMSVDFGVPDANKAFEIDVSSADVDVLGQILTVVDYARSIGMPISGMVTSGKAMAKLVGNNGVSKAVHGGASTGALVTRSQLSGLFQELFGFGAIETYDARYNLENAAGVKTPTRFYPDDKISFVSGLNGLDGFGAGLWGVTPEEMTLGGWTDKSAEQFITLTQWTEQDPTAVWSKASGLFAPVLPNPDGLFIADVDYTGE